LGSDHFVDLDVINSVDKQLLSLGRRTRPMPSNEARRFAWHVGHPFQRFPFPDDLSPSLGPLRDRIKGKWQRPQSAEGRRWAEVRDVRAQALPSWEATGVSVSLTFIFSRGVLPPVPDEAEPLDRALAEWLQHERTAAEIADRIEATGDSAELAYLYDALVDAWVAICTPQGTITSVDASASDEDEYSVSSYWDSEAIDLNQLSGPFT